MFLVNKLTSKQSKQVIPIRVYSSTCLNVSLNLTNYLEVNFYMVMSILNNPQSDIVDALQRVLTHSLDKLE